MVVYLRAAFIAFNLIVCAYASERSAADNNVAEGGGDNETNVNEMIRKAHNNKAPLNNPVLISDAELDKKQHYQYDPTNIYERFTWDPKFCNPLASALLLDKIMFDDPKVFRDEMSLVCKKSVEIGMRMISLLRNELLWPFYPDRLEDINQGMINPDSNLERMSEDSIDLSEVIFGDGHKVRAVIADIDPETYEIKKIDYTDDYRSIWNERNPNELPIHILSDSFIGFVMEDSSMDAPAVKTLGNLLLQLFGHDKYYAETWLFGDSDSDNMGYHDFGIEAVLHTIYATLIVMAEDMANMDAKLNIPRYDDESLDQFISDLRVFIDDLKYDQVRTYTQKEKMAKMSSTLMEDGIDIYDELKQELLSGELEEFADELGLRHELEALEKALANNPNLLYELADELDENDENDEL